MEENQFNTVLKNLFEGLFEGTIPNIPSPQTTKTVTEKEPLKLRITNTSEMDKIEIFYFAKTYAEGIPHIRLEDKDLVIEYKGQTKKAKFSKYPTKYFLDSDYRFNCISFILHKDKKIVPLEQVFTRNYQKEEWEQQIADNELRKIRLNEECFRNY